MGHLDPDVLTSAGYLLLKAGHEFGDMVDEVLTRFDLDGRDLMVLSHIAAAELSQMELSRRLNVDPTIVVALIDGLEARKAVVRHRDPADRRRYLLAITPAGRALMKKATAACITAQDDLLQPLSTDDRERLRLLLLDVMGPRLAWMA